MIRNNLTPIDGRLFAQCKIASLLDGTNCAETWIELTLRAALEQRPEIARIAEVRAQKRKEADAQLCEEYPSLTL